MKRKDNTIAELERVAKLLDNQFRIGPFSFGLDPIIGLVPGLGDIIPLFFSIYLIILAKREELDDYVIHQIIGNMAVDFILGTVPIIGDAGDFFFKASERNLAILKRELHKKYDTNKETVLEGTVISEIFSR